MQLHTLWDGLFQIAGYMIILGTLLGWTCLIGMFIIVCSIPVMGKISIKMFGYNRSMVKVSSQINRDSSQINRDGKFDEFLMMALPLRPTPSTLIIE